MAWEAHTSFRRIQPGAVFALIESPQTDVPSTLAVRDEFWIVDADERRRRANVIKASEAEIIIEERNGIRFTMTPRRPGELESHLRAEMRWSQWVVREIG